MLLAAPEAVAEVTTEPGLVMPKLLILEGGVVVSLLADSMIFPSTPAKYFSSMASVSIPFAVPGLCFDHGVEGEATDLGGGGGGGVRGETVAFLVLFPPPEPWWSDVGRAGRDGT